MGKAGDDREGGMTLDCVGMDEVEAAAGFRPTERQLRDALEIARRKQGRICAAGRPEAMEHWYLVELVAEAAKDEALSEATAMAFLWPCGPAPRGSGTGQGESDRQRG